MSRVNLVDYPDTGLFSAFSPARAVKIAREAYGVIVRLRREEGLIHLPSQQGTYGFFLRMPYIITVHNVARLDVKQRSAALGRWSLRHLLELPFERMGVRQAAKVIAVSHDAKRDLIEYLGLAEERIAVVYNGIDHKLFKPVQPKSVGCPYILYVGVEQPRKNFVGVLRAFKELKGQAEFADLKLIKIGEAGRPQPTKFRQTSLQAIRGLGLSDDVIFTGQLPQEELPAYYSGAECLLHPSFYECCSLTVLEAMACGCPVITSNGGSLLEVFGSAALLVDPNDIDSMAEASRQVLTNNGLKEELRAKGLALAQGFSWEKAAEATMKVYDDVEKSGSVQGLESQSDAVR